MKYGYVIKNASVAVEEELELVNRYTRRKLNADEVYLFTVALCDNEVDRDFERFTVEALFELERLFVGKTGIIDHDPSAMNMKARIISCAVEAPENRKTTLGDDYFRLTARAYIPKNDHTAELIELIDTGIIKEVSVGCAVTHTRCSVCGEEMHSPACSHRKGQLYGSERCYGELSGVSDAYEFSFVAVPAQRDAGVVKAMRKEMNMEEIIKSIKAGVACSFSEGELRQLSDYITELETHMREATLYRAELEKSAVAQLAQQLSMDTQMLSHIVKKLSVDELRSLSTAAKSETEARPQLALPVASRSGQNTQFTI